VDAVIAAHIREITDAELAQLVSQIHTQRSTFGFNGDTPVSAAAQQASAA